MWLYRSLIGRAVLLVTKEHSVDLVLVSTEQEARGLFRQFADESCCFSKSRNLERRCVVIRPDGVRRRGQIVLPREWVKKYGPAFRIGLGFLKARCGRDARCRRDVGEMRDAGEMRERCEM